MLRKNRSVLMLTCAALLALTTLADCGSSSSKGISDTLPPTTKAAGPPVVLIGKTKLGPTLVDANGHTLYVYDVDPDSVTTCIQGLCAFAWHPLTVETSTVVVGPGLRPSWFKTIPGLKGVKVVTVKGRPLYRASGEKGPAMTLGQGVSGVWHAVNDQGEAID
jgi:predicted lipoprotein with Yx(FWY)xxD motif